jgi:hypothetical protein
MRIGPLLQYFCSSCGKTLKENTTIEFQKDQLKEECPGCGALLIDTLQNRRKVSESLWEQEQVNNTARGKSWRHLSVDFKTAYRQIEDRGHLTFDIEKIDSLLNLNAYGSLCIIGKQRYVQLLINRLCVHTMLPKKYGGVSEGYSKIIAIDAGNCTDVYQFVDFARQYGLEVKKVLQSVIVSRVFTIYQLAHVIIYELPQIIEKLSSDKKNNFIVVVYGLLDMFMSDPHIDKADAKKLIKEIASSIRKLSEERFVIISFNHLPEYDKHLLPVFDHTIDMSAAVGSIGLLQTRVHNQHVGTKGTSTGVVLRKSDLSFVALT